MPTPTDPVARRFPSGTRRAGPTGSWPPDRVPGRLGISSGKGGRGEIVGDREPGSVARRARGHDVGLLDAPTSTDSRCRRRAGGAPSRPSTISSCRLSCTVVRVVVDGLFVPLMSSPCPPGVVQCCTRRSSSSSSIPTLDYPDFLLIDTVPPVPDRGPVPSRTEIVVVTTPQAAAQRVVSAFGLCGEEAQVAVRGVVENMSWFTRRTDDALLVVRCCGWALADDLEGRGSARSRPPGGR